MLDFGSSSVILAELERDKKDGIWRLKNFGMVGLPPEAIVDGAVMNTMVIVDAIRELVARHKIKTKEVAASVAGHSVIIKRINNANLYSSINHQPVTTNTQNQ